jgi:uncharacterized membrane protein
MPLIMIGGGAKAICLVFYGLAMLTAHVLLFTARIYYGLARDIHFELAVYLSVMSFAVVGLVC